MLATKIIGQEAENHYKIDMKDSKNRGEGNKKMIKKSLEKKKYSPQGVHNIMNNTKLMFIIFQK